MPTSAPYNYKTSAGSFIMLLRIINERHNLSTFRNKRRIFAVSELMNDVLKIITSNSPIKLTLVRGKSCYNKCNQVFVSKKLLLFL